MGNHAKGAAMNDLVSRALSFATEAHASVQQIRKYTGEPYINHPIEVMPICCACIWGNSFDKRIWRHEAPG